MIKKSINRFALGLASLAIVFQLLIIYTYKEITSLEPVILVQILPTYFLLINLIMHYFLLKSAQESSSKFVRTFMLSTTAKMMISLIFIVIIGFVTKPDFKAPILTFVSLYLVFMVVEVIFIVKDLKQLSNKN